jgi:hypothetical protein
VIDREKLLEGRGPDVPFRLFDGYRFQISRFQPSALNNPENTCRLWKFHRHFRPPRKIRVRDNNLIIPLVLRLYILRVFPWISIHVLYGGKPSQSGSVFEAFFFGVSLYFLLIIHHKADRFSLHSSPPISEILFH